MPEDAKPATSAEPPTSDGASSDSTPDVASLLSKIVERLDAQDTRMGDIDGRLSLAGKDMGRIRERLKIEDKPANGATPKAAPGMTSSDMMAAVKLGAVQGKLPETAQQYIQAQIEAGKPFSEILSMAEAISSSIPKAEAATASATPTGQAATAAPRTSSGWPKTQSELKRLAATNPKVFEEIMGPNSDFDPNSLPAR